MPNSEPQVGGLIDWYMIRDILLLILVMAIIIFTGLNAINQVSKQFDDSCNAIYGQNNWYVIQNGSNGMSLRYQCVRINESMP